MWDQMLIYTINILRIVKKIIDFDEKTWLIFIFPENNFWKWKGMF